MEKIERIWEKIQSIEEVVSIQFYKKCVFVEEIYDVYAAAGEEKAFADFCKNELECTRSYGYKMIGVSRAFKDSEWEVVEKLSPRAMVAASTNKEHLPAIEERAKDLNNVTSTDIKETVAEEKKKGNGKPSSNGASKRNYKPKFKFPEGIKDEAPVTVKQVQQEVSTCVESKVKEATEMLDLQDYGGKFEVVSTDRKEIRNVLGEAAQLARKITIAEKG